MFMSVIRKITSIVGQFCEYLFLTPSWGSKRRRAQQEYEDKLDSAMIEPKSKPNA